MIPSASADQCNQQVLTSRRLRPLVYIRYGSSRIRCPPLHPPPHSLQLHLPPTARKHLPPHHIHPLTHSPIYCPKHRALPSSPPNPPSPSCPPTQPTLSPLIHLMLPKQLYGCAEQPYSLFLHCLRLSRLLTAEPVHKVVQLLHQQPVSGGPYAAHEYLGQLTGKGRCRVSSNRWAFHTCHSPEGFTISPGSWQQRYVVP